MTKLKKSILKIATSFFIALFLLFQSPSPILAISISDSYTDTSKINTGSSSSYQVASGQLKFLSPGGNVGWWKLNEASGYSFADSSGNSFTGTGNAGISATGGTITSSGGYTIHTFLSTENQITEDKNNSLATGDTAVGWWKMDESSGTSVADSSGDGNTGTATGTTIVTGNYGNARSFPDATTDYVNIPSVFSLGNTNVTITAWVNLDSTSESGAFVKVGGGDGGTNGYGIGVGASTFDDAGNNLILLYEGVRWADTNTNIGTGWHHVAMVINSSGVPSAYIDGALVNSYSGTNAVAPTGNTRIGGYAQSTNNRYVDALIDDVRIFNYARSGNGTFIPNGSGNAEALIVGGGGGTGSAYQGGGGGGGGIVYTSSYAVTATPYTVTVGAGGSGSAVGSETQANGGDSIFGNMTAYGGGRGGSEGVARSNGGSGGGGSHNANYSGGTATQGLNGTTRYGSNGGTVTGNNQSPWNAAGGGGAGAVGQTVAVNGATPGYGGDGISSSINGTATYYGGGGAGSNRTSATNSGGTGGGGATGVAGTANTGGGGGAGSHASSPTRIGGAGGSGIVIIRYPTDAGPTVVSGQYGNARSFNGTTDFIEVPDNNSLDLSTALTFSTWVYRNTDSGTFERIIGKSSTDGYDYWLQISSDDTLSCGVTKGDATTYSRKSTQTISTGVWTHLACTFDSTNGWNVYIDGTLSNGTISGTIGTARTSTRNFQIGRLGNGTAWDYSFSGTIDDMRIYNYVRSATQIVNDKNNTTYETSATVQSTNLLSAETSIISSIDNFVYNLSSKPVGTTATVQFSQDASNWYNSSGTLNGTDTLTTGANNTISFTALGWDTANFYYKIAFGGDGTTSPVLDDITLNYTTTGTCSTPPVGGGNYTVSTNCAFSPASETSLVRDLGATPTHGTITGTSVVPGKYGTARSFNGTSGSYVLVNDSNSLDIGTKLTITGWFKVTDTATNRAIISKVQEYLVRFNSDDTFSFFLWDGVDYEPRLTATANPSPDVWHHFAAVYDSTLGSNQMKLYIDGTLNNQQDRVITPTATTSDVYIGQFSASGYFSGSLDDIRVYNYARSADQVKDDMNEAPITTNLPVGWWKMDDGYIGGVDNGNITVQTGKTLTINAGQTMVWNPGKSIIIENGGSIAINLRSRLKQAYLWHTDADGDTYPAATSKLRWADTAPGQSVRWYLANAATDCNDSQNGPNLCCWARPAGTCNSGCDVTGCSTQQTSRFCVSSTQCGFETVTCYGNASDCGCSSDGTGICEQRTSSFTRYNTCQLPNNVCTLSNSSTCWEGILSCTWSW